MRRRGRVRSLCSHCLAVALMVAGGSIAPSGVAHAQAPPASPPRSPADSILTKVEGLVSEAPPATVIETAAPATLYYWNRPIATLRGRIGAQGPKARVAAALRRLSGMPERALRGEVRSRIGKFEGVDVALISIGDESVFGYLEADLDPLAQSNLNEASKEVVANLQRALAARTEQMRLPVFFRGLGEASVASLLTVVLILIIRRLRRWSLKAMSRGRLEGLRILEIDLAESARRVLARLLNLLLWSLDAVLVYLWVTFTLSRFPYTAPWGDALGGWLADTVRTFALALVHAVPDLVTIALILLIARAFVGLIRSRLLHVENGTIELSWLSPEVAGGARRIVVMAIWIFTFAIVFPFIPGSSSSAFKSVSVIVGLMFSLASAGFINHVMAGWVILFSRTVRVGDFVRVGGAEGIVTHLGALSIKIVDFRRQEIVLPNGVVTGTATTNLSRHAAAGRSLASTKLTIGYDAPWRQVHAMMLRAAARTDGVQASPAPRVLQVALSDFYVEYELVVEVETGRRVHIVSELHGHLQDEFNRNGVQIMSPHFEEQPAAPVVVPEPRWFAAPAIRGADEGAHEAARASAGAKGSKLDALLRARPKPSADE